MRGVILRWGGEFQVIEKQSLWKLPIITGGYMYNGYNLNFRILFSDVACLSLNDPSLSETHFFTRTHFHMFLIFLLELRVQSADPGVCVCVSVRVGVYLHDFTISEFSA